MIFVGAPEKGFFAEDYANKENIPFYYTETNSRIKQQTNSILKYGAQDYTIFDVEQYIDNSETIVAEIQRICSANNSKAIIYASGYNPSSEIISKFVGNDFKLFILACDLSGIKDQFEKCLNGYMETCGLEEIKGVTIEEKREEEKKSYNFKLIAVAGSCKRIGTTTHAVQIVKYLQLKGFKAAYIQMNASTYIKDVLTWYDEYVTDEDLGKVTYENVDHFYNLNKIADVLKLGYDYYVYDYGTYSDTDFNKISFLEKDIKIFILGSDATEMAFSQKVIKNSFYDDVKYIYNLTSEKDAADIMDLMDEKASNTFIASFVPDKYVFQNLSCIYEKIIPIQEKEHEKRELNSEKILKPRHFSFLQKSVKKREDGYE